MSEKYIAFISYSSRDSALAHRFCRHLETLKLPKSLRSARGRRRLGAVFLDRKNLRLSHGHWSEGIYDALDHTEYLVVLCTSSSADRGEVDTEITYFLEKHGGNLNRLIPVIVEGEPWYSKEEVERCLPDSLRPHWDTLKARNLPTWKEVQGYSMLQGGDQARLARWLAVQVAASILSEAPDKLWSIIEAEKKIRNTVIASVSLVMVMTMGALSWWAVNEKRRAQHIRASALYLSAEEEFATNDFSTGLAYLGASLRLQNHPVASRRLEGLLRQESWFVPVSQQPDDAAFTEPQTEAMPDNLSFDATGGLWFEQAAGVYELLYQTDSGKALEPLGHLYNNALYAFLESSERSIPGRLGLREDIHTLLIYELAAGTLHARHTFPGRLIGVALSPVDERVYVAHAPRRHGKAELSAFHVRAGMLNDTRPIWTRQIPSDSTRPKLSPDGQTLLLHNPEAGQVRLAMYDGANGANANPGLLTSLPSHLVFGPNGKRLALVDASQTLRLINLGWQLHDSVNPLRLPKRPSGLAFSENGRYLRVQMPNNETRLYRLQVNAPFFHLLNIRTFGTVEQVLSLPGSALMVIQNDTDGRSMVEAFSMSGQSMSNALLLESAISEAALCADGSLMAFTSKDNPGRLFFLDVLPDEPKASGRFKLALRSSWQAQDTVARLRFHPYKKELLFNLLSPEGDRIALCNPEAADVVPVISAPQPKVNDMLFSKDGKLVLCAGEEGISAWESATLAKRETGPAVTERVTALERNAQSGGLLAALDDELRYFNTDGNLVWSFSLADKFGEADFSPLGDIVAVLVGSRDIHLLDVRSGKQVRRNFSTPWPVRTMHITDDLSNDPPVLMVSTQAALDTTGISATVDERAREPGGMLLLYDLHDTKKALWKVMPLAVGVRGFADNPDSPLVIWDKEGLASMPGLSVSGKTEPKAADIAEALGGWRLDIDEIPTPAPVSLADAPETLAVTPLWREYLSWLRSPPDQRTLLPGSGPLVRATLDNLLERDYSYYNALRLLSVDPANERILTKMWDLTVYDQAKKLFVNSPQRKEEPPEEVERSFFRHLLFQDSDLIFSFPSNRALGDFWTSRALNLYPDSIMALEARASFLVQTLQFEEAEKLLSEALKQYPAAYELYDPMSVVAWHKGNTTQSLELVNTIKGSLREQKDLDEEALLFYSTLALKRAVLMRRPDLVERMTNELLSDIERCFGDTPYLGSEDISLLSCGVENWLQELRQWPSDESKLQIINIMEHELELIEDKLVSAEGRRLCSLLQLHLGVQYLLSPSPEKALELLAQENCAEESLMQPFLFYRTIAEVQAGDEEKGQRSLLAIVNTALQNSDYNNAYGYLAFFYVLRMRNLDSPAYAPPCAVLEQFLASDLAKGFFSVKTVTPGGAADKAGLLPGDRVLRLQGVPVLYANHLIGGHLMLRDKETALLHITRNGWPQTLDLPSGWLGAEFLNEIFY